MALPNTPDRRALIATLATLPLTASGRGQNPSSSSAGVQSRTLVAYFSRTGNTRVIAGLIQRSYTADLFEIRPRVPYPEEYLATVEQARQERDRGFEPALQDQASELAGVDTIFLGFPIWGETVPPVVRAFLSTHDLAGKTLIPFVTHGGYGPGNSQSVLASHAPKSNLSAAFVMECDRERQTMERVNAWLGQLTPSSKSS